MTAVRRRPAVLLTFLLVVFEVAAQEQVIPLQPPPGTYGTDVELRLSNEESLQYRFIGTDDVPHTDFFLPFDAALLLSAPAGGEARYRIEFAGGETRTVLEYHIDLRPPSPPLPDPLPDLYTTDQVVTAESDEDARIYVLAESGGFVPVDSERPIRIQGEPGEIVDRDVVLYAEDSVGNRSETRVYTYRIDRRGERRAPERIIVSPVPGSFANEQLLLLDTEGLRDVVYTRTGSRNDSGAYATPRILPGEGTFSLVVTGTEVLTGLERVERVEWSQGVTAETGGSVSSGIVTEDLVIDPPAENLRYTLQDRPVRSIDPIQREPLTLPVTPDARRTVVLRREHAESGANERYVIVLDGRRPPPPRAVVVGDQIRLIGLADTEIAYLTGTRDGDPDEARAYEGPQTRARGTDTDIVAWARYRGGAWSAPLSTRIVGRTEEAPLAESELRWDGTTLTLDVPPGYRYLIPELSPLTAIAPGVLRYRPPRGFDRVLSVRGGNRDLSILVDTAPPAPPTVESRGARVTIVGDGELFYRIDGGSFQSYQEELLLQGEEGVRIDYRVDAYRIVDGEQSTIARSVVPVDRRPLALPPFLEAVDGGILRDGELSLQFAGSYEDLLVHYELSYQGTPRIPTEASPSTSSSILVSTPEGEVRQWQLALRGRFQGRPGWTPVRRVSFLVDRVPPDPPVLIRPTTPLEGSDRFIVEFGTIEDDARLYYRLDENQLYVPYSGPVSVNPPESGTRTYRIDAYTVDTAGNRTHLSEPLVATLSSNRPDAPVYAVNGRTIHSTGVSLNREAILSLARETPAIDRVFWRIFDESDGGFIPYEEPYRLRMPEEGEERTVRVEAYRETPDGLRSPVSPMTIVLDRSSPVRPSAPFVHRTDDGRRGILVWPGAESRQVFVAFDEDSEEVFIPTDGQISWSLPPGRDSLRVTYFTIDAAGNRSESGVLTIREPETVYVPEVSGVENGGIYRSERTVELRSDLPVRYTLGLDGTSPPPVHPLSALYEEPLRFTASMNEEVTVRIRFRSQNSEGVLSEEGTTSFTIDRRAPDPPTITGVASDAYYPDSRRATLNGSDVDRIVYRAYRSDGAAAPEFREYRGEPIDLPAVDGTLARYRIEAYTIDPAGNRSEETEQWSVYIDREIVYVSADTPSGGTGSRTQPFRELSDAFAAAAAEGRRTIFLTSGAYEVSNAVLRAAATQIDDLAIIGGFSPDQWSEESDPTTIRAEEGAVELAGNLRIRGLTVRGGLRITPGATVDLRNVVLRGGATTPTVVDAGASLHMGDGRVHGPLVVSGAGSVVLDGGESDDIYVDGGSVTLLDGASGPIVGNGASILLRSASLTVPPRAPVPPASMTALPGVNTASLLVLRDSSLVVEDSVLDSSSDHANTTMMSVEGGSSTLWNSTVRARAEGAALAIRQRDGDVLVRDSRIIAAGGRYSYGVAVRGGSLTFLNSVIRLEGGEELVGIINNGSTATMVHSLLDLEPAQESRIIQGITTNGSARAFVINSIITQEPGSAVPESPSSGFSLDAESTVSVYGSLLAGWTQDLRRSAGPMQWSTRDTVLRADRFAAASFGEDNLSAGGFPTDLRSSLLVEMDVNDIAASFLNADLSLPADGGIALTRLPPEVLDHLGGDETVLEVDLRGVRRSLERPDIGPIEF